MTKSNSTQQISIALPAGVDRKDMSKLLSQIAKENGFFSAQHPNHGSIGHMLHAIATGRAAVVNLEQRGEPQKNEDI